MAYRNEVITRGHETNIYAEATVRLLKDIMLDRRKAFIVVALVGYIVDVLEPYYEKRLYEVASGRPSPLLAAFSKLQNTANTVSLKGTIQIGPNTYQVPSASQKNTYIVNIQAGVCTCARGERGALYKHQLALCNNKELSLPNLPPVTYKERHELAVLALGARAPPVKFFMTDVELLGGADTSPLQQDTHPSSEAELPDCPADTEAAVDDSHINDVHDMRDARHWQRNSPVCQLC